ncbi:MAG: hypothetical protein ACI89L_002460 [Phycisphaerales bacterium]|jgi:hypothetical protein
MVSQGDMFDRDELEKEEPGHLKRRYERAIVALLSYPTILKAAQAIGISERTLYLWMRRDDFSRAYRAARRDAYGQAVGLMQQYAAAAVQTLAQIMVNPKAPHTARVNAATTLLRNAREGIELDDLASRLAELERLIAESGPGGLV